mmetsp:Transcript_4228/g.6229  ORF Transcript_4228/g.6229 Transcript_4228/m.6229 type:complete len:411 (+) Transcript_4228:133-1365(+)
MNLNSTRKRDHSSDGLKNTSDKKRKKLNEKKNGNKEIKEYNPKDLKTTEHDYYFAGSSHNIASARFFDVKKIPKEVALIDGKKCEVCRCHGHYTNFSIHHRKSYAAYFYSVCPDFRMEISKRNKKYINLPTVEVNSVSLYGSDFMVLKGSNFNILSSPHLYLGKDWQKSPFEYQIISINSEQIVAKRTSDLPSKISNITLTSSELCVITHKFSQIFNNRLTDKLSSEFKSYNIDFEEKKKKKEFKNVAMPFLNYARHQKFSLYDIIEKLKKFYESLPNDLKLQSNVNHNLDMNHSDGSAGLLSDFYSSSFSQIPNSHNPQVNPSHNVSPFESNIFDNNNFTLNHENNNYLTSTNFNNVDNTSDNDVKDNSVEPLGSNKVHQKESDESDDDEEEDETFKNSNNKDDDLFFY